jgi:integrase
MTATNGIQELRLKRHGRRNVVRERYQRPRIRDLGTKRKIFYWDYSAGKRRGRTKSWSKNSAPTRAETRRLADQFMEEVNDRNSQPLPLALKGDTLDALVAICREKIWPLLKNSTRISSDFYLDTHILPRWGTIRVVKTRTLELQDFFNSYSPRLASRTIRNMHACLRAVLNQGKVWGLIRVNPAVGVGLPRKKVRKPPVLLSRQDIRRVIDELPKPTKSIVTLIVVGSLRVGEAVALRWGRVLSDRIEITERFYAGEFDDAKTNAGRRSIPLDSFGILRGVLDRAWARSKRHEPEDSIFTNARGGPLDRHNLSRRHLKPAIKKLGLPPTVDFRNFRTMHSSLMSSVGVQREVTRDNMGLATIDVT